MCETDQSAEGEGCGYLRERESHPLGMTWWDMELAGSEGPLGSGSWRGGIPVTVCSLGITGCVGVGTGQAAIGQEGS